MDGLVRSNDCKEEALSYRMVGNVGGGAGRGRRRGPELYRKKPLDWYITVANYFRRVGFLRGDIPIINGFLPPLSLSLSILLGEIEAAV